MCNEYECLKCVDGYSLIYYDCFKCSQNCLECTKSECLNALMDIIWIIKIALNVMIIVYYVMMHWKLFRMWWE